MTSLLAFRALRDNLIWALADGEGSALLVDPGEAAPVHAALDRGLSLGAILLSHHHADHVDGAAELAERTGVPVFAPDDSRIRALHRAVGGGERFTVDGRTVDVLAVPGHTRTHIAFHVDGHLFSGDTLFSLGCGRMFEGTPAQMWSSLQSLAALPPGTRVCCGHEYTLANGVFAKAAEPHNAEREAWLAEARRRLAAGQPSLPSTIEVERAANPFLRCALPAVQATLRERGDDFDDPVQAFAALRRWKDGFA